MDNNKNRLKDRPKSNAELRKMYSEAGAEIAMEKGKKRGSNVNGKKYTKRSKLSHNNQEADTMTHRNCKTKNKAYATSKNYAESMKNQAHDQSPYGQAEPSIHTTYK